MKNMTTRTDVLGAVGKAKEGKGNTNGEGKGTPGVNDLDSWHLVLPH